MNGQRALIYSRIRENQLNPGENDLTRGARQQAVAQAATAKLTSPSTLLGLPFDGDSLMRPLTTDLSTAQLLELGWVKFRASASHTLYCRLGGDATSAGGASVIIPSEDNRNVLSMWAGLSAPQPPTTTYGPGLPHRPPAPVAAASPSDGSSDDSPTVRVDEPLDEPELTTTTSPRTTTTSPSEPTTSPTSRESLPPLRPPRP